MAAILVGCSASDDEIQSEKSAEAFTEDDSYALHVDDADEASTTKVSIDNSPEAQLQTVTLNETVAENIEINIDSAVYDYSDIDEESKQLYRDFLEGNATAIFKENDADVTENNWFSGLFHTGDSYSLEDIVNGVITSDTYNVEAFEKIFCTYLDCGTDNEYEFLVLKN